jgi:hypothetical protein
MNRRIRISLLLAGLLASGAGIYYAFAATTSVPQPAPANPPPSVQTVNGEVAVTVAPEVQRASGIATLPLAAAQAMLERTAYASVVDVQPLLDAAYRLAAAQTEREGALAQVDLARAQFERTQALYLDDANASMKSVQEVRAAWQVDQAKLHSLDAANNALRANIRLQFGSVIAKAVENPHSKILQSLFERRASIVRVTLPQQQDVSNKSSITIDGSGSHAVVARQLSAAPQVDPAIQGNSYLYLSEQVFPMGLHVTARLAQEPSRAGAVTLPDSAIVWHGGQRWTYVRTAVDRFTRRLVEPVAISRGGLIVERGFHAGDAVVVRGTQLLLSEEQRPQGIATQCEDPPECDD